MNRRELSAAIATSLVAASTLRPAAAAAASMADFERDLERLRLANHIPGVSAAIARGQSIVWQKGFGLADIAAARAPDSKTIYHLASLTKPICATVLLQLVQEGKVSLDDPVAKYGVKLDGSGTILVRHLISHTSEGVPGTRYNYNGNRFDEIGAVIRQAEGKPLVRSLQDRIFVPLGLQDTAPNPKSEAFQAAGKDPAAYVARMATGYTWKDGQNVVTPYPAGFGAAAGLTSSAADVLAFSMAMDRNALLAPQTRELAWTAATGEGGKILPYGLGWFVTPYRNRKVVWHYGLWTAISALIVKVPDQQLTFVALANSDGLSSPYQLGAGKLASSPWARAFLDAFALARTPPA